MKKTRLAMIFGFAALIVAGSILGTHAATAVTTTCAGTVTNNQVVWTATSTGGNGPYTYLWGGDASIAGSTSTAITVTYGTNGTRNATIQAMDASSTIATSTCVATVTSNVVATPTSTLNVLVLVNNTAGGSAVPASFIVTMNGANATPASFSGVAAGTAVVVNASTSYSVSATSVANYTMSKSGNCTGPIAAGVTNSCTITETYVAPVITPTSTTPAPRMIPPMLSVGPNGAFLGRGMTVTSVGTNSFQASVWGVTYTINWSGSLNGGGEGKFNFFFRHGNSASSTVNPVAQLKVGDEVGVSGKIDAASPLVVTANVVRDYSITMPRMGDQGNGTGNGNGNHEGNGSSSDFHSKIQDLMGKIQGLQGKLKGNNGKGNDH